MRFLVRVPARIAFKSTAAFFWRHPTLTKRALASPQGRKAVVGLLSWLATRPPRFDQVLYSIMRRGSPADVLALAKASMSAGDSAGAFAARVHLLSLARRLDEVADQLAHQDVRPDDALLTPARVEALRSGRVGEVIADEVLLDELDSPPSRRTALVSVIAAPFDFLIGGTAKILLRPPSIARHVVRSTAGRYVLALLMACLAWNPSRFNSVFYAVVRTALSEDCSAIADCAERLCRIRYGYGLLVTRLYFLNRAQRYQDALALLESYELILRDDPLVTPARIDALFHEDLRADVLRVVTTTRVDPSYLDRHGSYLLAAVAAACQKQPGLVADCFARQVGIAPRNVDGKRSTVDPADIWREVADRTLAALSPIDRFDLTGVGRVGFFYHNMPHSLGHSLHEPYFFLSMYRNRYDRIYLIGGDLASYQPGPRACMDIVNQYCRHITSHDGFFHNLAHTDLGHYSHGPLEFHAMHNWSLMREATLRTRDPADSFRLGDWRMTLPQRFLDLGETFCRAWNIDVTCPIVAFHVRSHESLQINRQALRNADVADYIPALEWLIANGYQVIRLGDTRMPRLDLNSPHFHELPFMAGYAAELDAYFVAKARFMVTSPSGPVAHALALGTPFVVVNSILNYLHVSPGPEMHCFKVYVDARTGRELPLREAIERRLFLNMHEPELRRAGYAVRNATSEEILASVRDMVEWVAHPDLPLTDRQRRFAETADRMAVELSNDPNVDPPIADFIGFSLPNFRIAPSVAESRNDFPDSAA